MVEMDQIMAFAVRIAKEFRPERIILFGSYAHGDPRQDSDVDLLVVMPLERKGVWKSIEILDKLDPRFPVDLLVRSPEDIERRLAWTDFFIREILEKGRILYEADHN